MLTTAIDMLDTVHRSTRSCFFQFFLSSIFIYSQNNTVFITGILQRVNQNNRWNYSLILENQGTAEVDPGFPRWRGAPTAQGGGVNLLFGQNFPENCMKMKEIGPGGTHPWRPPWIRQC